MSKTAARRNARGARHATPLAAFTLVELLVVIGIIAVLMGLLLGALAAAREQSKMAKCLSNLRQIGAAITMYANEHSGCLVPGDYRGLVDGYPLPGAGNWADILVGEKYIEAPLGTYNPGDINGANYSGIANADADNVLRCPNGGDNFGGSAAPPSQTDGQGTMWFDRGSDFQQEAARTWYAVNVAVIQDIANNKLTPFNFLPDIQASGENWKINRLTSFQNSSQLPLVFDGLWMFNYEPTRINARHGLIKRLTNVLFADGHCESLPTNTLPNDDWYVR